MGIEEKGEGNWESRRKILKRMESEENCKKEWSGEGIGNEEIWINEGE